MIGEPLRRREDLPLVRGAGRYVDDLALPGMAHVAFVRSHHARARIVGIRVPSRAPGLVRVFTAADLAGRARPLPVIAPEGAQLAEAPHPILASDEVRYAGQPVAAVVAESRAQAVDAAELVEVEYEPLQAVVDPDEAPETLMRWERTAGDVDGALIAAAHRVRAEYRIPRLVAAPIEPRGVVAAYDEPADLLTMWASAQDPHRPLSQLAHALGRPPERIRVAVPDVGGAFGSKGVIAVEAVAVALAAIELGRPVKWVEDRVENFLGAYQGRGVQASVELALDAGGRMLAVRASILADLGAYLLPTTAVPPHTTAMLMTGCYDIPAAAVSVRGARTDKVPTGPYRGAGRPEAAYLLELTVDRAARELGLDPVELRRRNLIRSFPHRSALGWTYDSGDYERCLDRALELVGPERGTARRDRGGHVRRARGRQLGERAGVGRPWRPRDRPERIVPARPGARDDVRADRGGSAGDRSRRRRAAVRRDPRRRDVREPLGGHGRLGARAGGRADRGRGAARGGGAARLRRRGGDPGGRALDRARRTHGRLGRGRRGGRRSRGGDALRVRPRVRVGRVRGGGRDRARDRAR